jgi:hypothetical protein
MVDDAKTARNLCCHGGQLFGIVHMTVEQRIERENVLLAAFAALREECAKVAENYTYGGEKYYTYEEQHFTKDIAHAIRTANHAAIDVPGLGRLTESPEGEWTDE